MAFQRRKPAAIGVKAPFAGFIGPALATAIEQVSARERSVMDIYDGADWTALDTGRLKSSIEHGNSIKEAAKFVCRASSIEDVARKAEELRLKLKRSRRAR
jgi:hypothetical protein